MMHSMGDVRSKIHGRALLGVDQGNRDAAGMRVVNCEGKLGTVASPHCSYGATVQYDDGTRYYTDTACLWREGDRTACPPQCDGTYHGSACPVCGDLHYVSMWFPGRVMGGIWVAGAHARECRANGHRLSYTPDKD